MDLYCKIEKNESAQKDKFSQMPVADYFRNPGFEYQVYGMICVQTKDVKIIVMVVMGGVAELSLDLLSAI